MTNKNIIFFIICLCFVTVITSACGPFEKANIGDYIEIGSYPQSANGESKPIEWLVLSKEGNKMLVISKYGLDVRRFDGNGNNWSGSKIRQWLNYDFYNKAFNEKEKKYIKSFINTDSIIDRNNNADNVFLLSIEEVKKYFSNDESRKCKATEYAVTKGKKGSAIADDYSNWLLRSTDLVFVNNVSIVRNDGHFDIKKGKDRLVVRPALWLKI